MKAKKYTKKQIQESIRYWQKQLKKMDEAVDTHLYSVEATSPLGELGEDFTARDLVDLASQVRGTIAFMNGREDDDGLSTSWIPFEYTSVIDENGVDLTKEANAAK